MVPTADIKGHVDSPHCSARPDSTGFAYDCTTAWDCGDDMECVGSRNMAAGTACEFKWGAEKGPTCRSNADCKPKSEGDSAMLCMRPEGIAPPGLRFCRVPVARGKR
jgi:hypothetical protein